MRIRRIFVFFVILFATFTFASAQKSTTKTNTAKTKAGSEKPTTITVPGEDPFKLTIGNKPLVEAGVSYDVFLLDYSYMKLKFMVDSTIKSNSLDLIHRSVEMLFADAAELCADIDCTQINAFVRQSNIRKPSSDTFRIGKSNVVRVNITLPLQYKDLVRDRIVATKQ